MDQRGGIPRDAQLLGQVATRAMVVEPSSEHAGMRSRHTAAASITVSPGYLNARAGDSEDFLKPLSNNKPQAHPKGLSRRVDNSECDWP